MLDFAIVYEHKNRELETACLIKSLLESKGYTCEVLYIFSLKRAICNPKVVIYPYLYSTEACKEANSFLVSQKRPVINLQYEQVITKAAEDSGFYYPKGDAKNAMHITWGKSSTDRLENGAGIAKTHISQVGNISLTLNDKSFKKFYLDKRQMSEKYGISQNSKWHIFISSFTFVTIESKKNFDKDNTDESEFIYRNDFLNISRESRKEILRWFKDYCKEHNDETIIYRPHPNETIDNTLVKMQEEIKNFYVISEYSIRQWIFLADSLLTWISTSIADIFFAEKSCLILRPKDVPVSYDSEMLLTAEKIKTKEDFFDKMSDTKQNFPVSDEKIRYYYCNATPEKVFSDFTKCCEHVYENKEEYEVETSGNKFYATLLYNILLSIGSRIKLYKITKGLLSERLKYSYKENRNVRGLKKKYIKNFRKYFSDTVDVR
ncbi:MAG: hypothetical protein IK057_05045 [Clostridia bacterium]|nr:hypothetical protein [Clostridia bacterium]